MTSKHNLTQKANRLRNLFVHYNRLISEISTKPGLLTATEQRNLTRYFRLMKRTYDDLRAVEGKLRKMP